MKDTKVFVAVLLTRFIYAGMQIFSKAAFNGGMSTSVFVFYRQLVATLFLMPVAFVLERKTAPALPFRLCFKMFMLALVGIAGTLSLFSVALDYTSAALVSAAINSIPVITFILSVILRMERLKLKRHSGIAKITGIGLCAAGVLTMAFYSGPRFQPLNHHHILQRGHQAQSHLHNKWLLGTFIMMMANITWSLWMVLQVGSASLLYFFLKENEGPLMKEYPSQLLFTTLQSLFSTIQTFFIALAMERDFARWRLGFDLSLLSVAYCGIMVAGVVFFLQSWVIHKKGAVFLTTSIPLTLIITMILSSFLLGEVVGLESMLGGILMVGGLYSVLWGKRREQREEEIPSKAGLEEKEMAPPPA